MRLSRACLALIFVLAARGESVHIRVLATTDLHGNIFPYDYYTSQPAPRGLAKIATLIARERASNLNTLLLDCGDTVQGSPLETVHLAAVRAGKSGPDPMMSAMNRLGYDAMTVGNHEFDLGVADLDRARRDAKFPWISANIEGSVAGHSSGFQAYAIKTVAGVRVAVIGVTTASVPSWEPAENFRGLKFTDAVEAVRRSVAAIQRRRLADVILVAAHTGIDRDAATGAMRTQDLPGENVAYQIAQIAGVDAVIFGHTHNEVGEYHVGPVLLMQPRNWGMSLGEMDLTLDRTGSGWKVASKSSRVIPVTAATPADEAVLSLARPYHDAAERYLDTPVAQAPVAMSAALARAEDTPVIDAIQAVQLEEAHAQVSFAAAFDIGVRLPKGAVTVRQIAALYPYDNTLYAIQTTGRVVREVLEYSAQYYNSCAQDCSPATQIDAPLINPAVYGYNYDIAEGVTYEIDLRRKAGERIVNLSWQGRPLADDQLLRVAINSYRAGGGGGYAMLRGAKVVYRSSEEVREMIIRYYTARGALNPSATGNWRIIPEEAHKQVVREAMEEAARPRLK
jgi:2',3'-cyclic-nucleotide 2'-phosphodiesterase / 3'-nucleotidase